MTKTRLAWLGAVACGAAFGWAWNRRRTPGRDLRFAAAYPPETGAVSAVTGGPPEDMNEMPPAIDPEREGPIYDGSDLQRH